MAETRKGRQTPTQSVVLPYSQTLGQDAINLYNATGRTAQEWQELLVSDILAVNDDKLWVHTKYGYAVPSRNGKNEIGAIHEMQGPKNAEHILHTAHRTTTGHAAWGGYAPCWTWPKYHTTRSWPRVPRASARRPWTDGSISAPVRQKTAWAR